MVNCIHICSHLNFTWGIFQREQEMCASQNTLVYINYQTVKHSIYSNGDLDLWLNDPKINMVLPLPQGNHVAKFGKDPIYRTKVIVRKPVWTHTRLPAIPNHIIRPVSRRAYKNEREMSKDKKVRRDSSMKIVLEYSLPSLQSIPISKLHENVKVP